MSLADLFPLANHLWQSTLFILVVWLLTLTLRNNRAQVRYCLWLVASVKFLVPFSALVAIGRQFQWQSSTDIVRPEVTYVFDAIGRPFSQAELITPPVTSGFNLTALLPILLLGVWFIGCAMHLLAWWIRWQRLSVIVRDALPLTTGRELDILRRLEGIVGIRRSVTLASSDSSLEPGIFGIMKPVLLWPRGISERLSDHQVQALLTHELCHVRRRDNLAAALHMMVEAVFWFHPLVWWLEKRLVDERERACDEAVIRLGSDPQWYAESILRTCEFCAASPLACVSGVTGSDLKQRIEAIMRSHGGQQLSILRKLLLATVGVIAFAVPISTGVLNAPPLRAQSAGITVVGPAFEVASVQPNKSGDQRFLTSDDVAQLEPQAAAYSAQAQPPSQANSVDADRQAIETALSDLRASVEKAATDRAERLRASQQQSPAARRLGFDVASIKPNKSGSPLLGITPQAGGRFTATNMSLGLLIRSAYQLPRFRMSGGPDWIESDRFDVVATAGYDAPQAEMRLMVQTLLAERFKLNANTETREQSVYELVIARRDGTLGSNLRRTDVDCAAADWPNPVSMTPRCGFIGSAPDVPLSSGRSRFALRGTSMDAFARFLPAAVGRYVVNRTGLYGHFDGEFDFTLEMGPPPPPPGIPDPYDRANFQTIFTIMQEQLGLRLEPSRGPVEVLVIDSVEQPTPD